MPLPYPIKCDYTVIDNLGIIVGERYDNYQLNRRTVGWFLTANKSPLYAYIGFSSTMRDWHTKTSASRHCVEASVCKHQSLNSGGKSVFANIDSPSLTKNRRTQTSVSRQRRKTDIYYKIIISEYISVELRLWCRLRNATTRLRCL
jgi:hypothetical protein